MNAMPDLIINPEHHDFARRTRFGRALDRVMRPVVYYLLKHLWRLAPGTVVVANARLTAHEHGYCVTIADGVSGPIIEGNTMWTGPTPPDPEAIKPKLRLV